MNLLTGSFAVMLLLIGLLGGIGICTPRRLWLKSAALGIVALSLPVTYVSLAELLGRPKPMHLEWHQIELTDANVVGFDLREDEAIYVWLRVEGIPEPRSYVLPWNQQRAQQLHQAQREAEANGTEVRVRRLPENGMEDEPVFYATPQQALPPKQPAGAFRTTSLPQPAPAPSVLRGRE